MKKKSVLLYIDRKREVDMLTDQQAGLLFKAVLNYADSGELPNFADLAMTILFSVFKSQIDENTEKYAEICRKRAEYGKKGGAPKGNKNAAKSKAEPEKTSKTSISLKKQAKQADTDTVTDTVTDTETDTEKKTHDFYTSVLSVYNTARAREEQHTTHTEAEVVEMLKENGYRWGKDEIECFLHYNEQVGWKLPLATAVRRWEAKRPEIKKTSDEMDRMADYLSLVNRFKDGEPDG